MDTTEEARQQILSIRSRRVAMSQLDDGAMEGALLTIEKGFSTEGHYLYEFIQNADDENSRAVRVLLEPKKVTILNAGDPFEYEDVKVLCNVAHSQKSQSKYIGYLGVGFKSVFLISDGPEVHSGPYHFAFRRPLNEEDFPWQIAPEWVEVSEVAPPWKTKFIIPLKGQWVAQKLSEEMKPESLNRRVLLFLQNVKRLELIDKTTGVERIIERTPVSDTTSEIQETSGGVSISEQWVLFSSNTVIIPPEIREDPLTQRWNRDKETHRAVTIAFKLNQDGGLEPVPGTVHMAVFSYLPIREESTRLKFIVQADFLTSFGRTRIQGDPPWNRWLAEQILELLKAKTIDLLRNPAWRMNALEILFPGMGTATDFFGINIEQPFSSYLKHEVQLPAYDGTWVTPDKALYVSDPNMWEVIGATDLEKLYGLKPIAQDIKIPYGLSVIQQAPSLYGNSNTKGFVSTPKGEDFLAEKAATHDLAFFKLLYKKMYEIGWQPATYRKAPLASTDIVLTSDGTVVSKYNVFFKPKGELSEAIESNFKFVHPALAEDTLSATFLETIGVTQLPDSEIHKAIASSVVPEVQKKWAELSKKERTDWLIKFRDMTEVGDVSVQALRDFLTVPTKSGKWLLAKDTLFPSEYSPELDVEPLCTLKVLDDPLIEFVRADFGNPAVPVESWKRFFQKLGVGELASESKLKSWANRVGIRMARKYEEKHNRRDIHEVTESERGITDPGYDLHSNKQGTDEERYIESKGTRGAGDFDLRPTTVQQMLVGDNKGRFFVYVTTQALSKPCLNIIQAKSLAGDVLLKVGDIGLSVDKIKVSEVININVLFP